MMVLGVATRNWSGSQLCVESWQKTASEKYPICVAENMTIPHAFQHIYENTSQPILAHIHDDVYITERNWDMRVLLEFEKPDVGLVGFAGALGHCLPNLYKEPFKIANMIRRDFLSNLRNAEDHGHRFLWETDVAVLDGLALFVRRSVIDAWGGWPVDKPYGYWMYAEALCCEVRRQQMRIRLVGVQCDHLGGKTVSMVPLTDDYERAHRFLYDNNRDVLPYHVGE